MPAEKAENDPAYAGNAKENPMSRRILITNDDGISADGLRKQVLVDKAPVPPHIGAHPVRERSRRKRRLAAVLAGKPHFVDRIYRRRQN